MLGNGRCTDRYLLAGVDVAGQRACHLASRLHFTLLAVKHFEIWEKGMIRTIETCLEYMGNSQSLDFRNTMWKQTL